MKRCPECGADAEPGSDRCVECGARLLTGKVAPPAPPPEPDEQGVPERGLHWVLETIPGLAMPAVLVYAIPFLLLVWLCMAGGAYLMTHGSGYTYVFMAVPGIFLLACAALGYGCAVAWLLAGEVCNPIDAAVDFKLRHWLTLFLLVTTPLGLAFAFLG